MSVGSDATLDSELRPDTDTDSARPPSPDPGPAPMAFGLRAVPRLFEELQRHETTARRRALSGLCDLIHDPERIYQTTTGGFLKQLEFLLRDEDPVVRRETCTLLHLVAGYSIGRAALLASSLLTPLARLLDDAPCRTNVHRVFNRLTLLHAGALALLPLVPRLLQQLTDEDEDEELLGLTLSTLGRCSTLDALPALSCGAVALVRPKLSHRCAAVRREAAAAMMALSVPLGGKQQVCKEQPVLPDVVDLLQDDDIEVQINAAGVIMYTVIITPGKERCLQLGVVAALVRLLSDRNQEEEEQEEEEEVNEERLGRRRTLLMYSLQALTSLAEHPWGRGLLLRELPLLVELSRGSDRVIGQAAHGAVTVVRSTP